MERSEQRTLSGVQDGSAPDWKHFLESVEQVLEACRERLSKEVFRKNAAIQALHGVQQRERDLQHTFYCLEEAYVRLEESSLVTQAAANNAFSRIKELETILADRDSALRALRQQGAALEERLVELTSRQEDADQLAAAERELERLQRSFQEREQELAEARAASALAISETQTRVQQLESECELLKARLTEEHTRLCQARQENEELERQHAQCRGELAAARAHFEEALEASQQKVALWQETHAALEKERDALQARLVELEKAAAAAENMGHSRYPQLGKRPRRSLLASPAQRIPVETKDFLSGRPSPFFGSIQRRLLQTPLGAALSPQPVADGQPAQDGDNPTTLTGQGSFSRRSLERLARQNLHIDYLRSLLEELETRLPLAEEQKRRFQLAIGQFDRMNRALQEAELAGERWMQRATDAEREQTELAQQLQHLQEEREECQRYIQELERALESPPQGAVSASEMTVSPEQFAQLEAELEQIRQQRKEFEGIMAAVVKQRDLYRQLLLRSLRGEQVVAP
jgi:chromosome segregation ATPase